MGVTMTTVKNQYLEIFLRTVWVMENPKLPFDRAHRVALGTGLEQLEHVLGRIREGITVKNQYFEIWPRTVWVIKNLK